MGIGGNIVKNDLFNDRISRFSIRKLHVGVCSVLLGTLVMLGTATGVGADEVTEEKQAEGVTATTEVGKAEASTTTEVVVEDVTYQADAAPVVAEDTVKPADKETEVAPVTEEKADTVAAENTAKRRTRRALGDANDPNLIADDVEDATSTPKVEKPTGFSSTNAKELVKQINWLDFGDTAAWTNTTKSKDGRTALQVGSTYTKEIMPGYVVNIKVKSLKPFQATEIYKKRMEDQGATEAEKATYDPNAKNGYIGTIRDSTTKAAFANREEALVVADAQNRWTEIRLEGIDTGSKRTTISSEYNGANIGVQFEISATFRGKVVKPAVVAADGESANPGEIVTFTTNGTGWQYVGEWKKGNSPTLNYAVQDTKDYFDPANDYGVSRNKWIDVDGVKIN